MRETHSEPIQTSKMKLFSKIANNKKLLTIAAKNSVQVVRLGSEYNSQSGKCLTKMTQ